MKQKKRKKKAREYWGNRMLRTASYRRFMHFVDFVADRNIDQ
jgi:hypothetical protein